MVIKYKNKRIRLYTLVYRNGINIFMKLIDSEKVISNAKKVFFCGDSFEQENVLLDLWESRAQQAIETNGFFNVGVSSNSLNKSTLDLFVKNSKRSIWSCSKLFCVDDLYAPSDNQASAAFALRQYLIEPLELDKKKFFFAPFAPTAHRSAIKLATSIRKELHVSRNELPTFDLIVLELNDKGQFASFNTDFILKNDVSSLTEVFNLSESIFPRITMTYPVIKNAKTVVVMVRGENSAKTLVDYLDGENELPISKFAEDIKELIFITDCNKHCLLHKEESGSLD